MSSDKIEIRECVDEIDYVLRENLSLEEWHECTSTDRVDLEIAIAHHLHEHGYDKFIDENAGLGLQFNYKSKEALEEIANMGWVYHNRFRIITELRNGEKYFKAKQIEKHETLLTCNEVCSSCRKASYSLNSLQYTN